MVDSFQPRRGNGAQFFLDRCELSKMWDAMVRNGNASAPRQLRFGDLLVLTSPVSPVNALGAVRAAGIAFVMVMPSELEDRVCGPTSALYRDRQHGETTGAGSRKEHWQAARRHLQPDAALRG